MCGTQKKTSLVWMLFLLFFNFQGVVPKVSVSLTFIAYSNPRGTKADGTCCDGNINSPCNNTCDQIFLVCSGSFINYKCNGKLVTTNKIAVENNITFSSHIGGTPNPIIFELDQWRRNNQFQINVLNVEKDKIPTLIDAFDGTVTQGLFVNHTSSFVGTLQKTILVVKFTTACANEYFGKDCSTVCKASLNGKCDNSGYIQCNKGWTGNNCEKDIDECSQVHSVCPKNSKCINNAGSYACPCKSGWTGLKCENIQNFCDTKPCQNNGTCIKDPTNFTCQCHHGWTGRTCAVKDNNCNGNICQNGAICRKNLFHTFECGCTSYWKGSNCTIDIDECKLHICANGGTCTNLSGDYKCNCTDRYTGRTCSKLKITCPDDYCLNGGTCATTNIYYSCTCTNGWTGNQCESSLHLLTQLPKWKIDSSTAIHNAFMSPLLWPSAVTALKQTSKFQPTSSSVTGQVTAFSSLLTPPTSSLSNHFSTSSQNHFSTSSVNQLSTSSLLKTSSSITHISTYGQYNTQTSPLNHITTFSLNYTLSSSLYNTPTSSSQSQSQSAKLSSQHDYLSTYTSSLELLYSSTHPHPSFHPQKSSHLSTVSLNEMFKSSQSNMSVLSHDPISTSSLHCTPLSSVILVSTSSLKSTPIALLNPFTTLSLHHVLGHNSVISPTLASSPSSQQSAASIVAISTDGTSSHHPAASTVTISTDGTSSHHPAASTVTISTDGTLSQHPAASTVTTSLLQHHPTETSFPQTSTTGTAVKGIYHLRFTKDLTNDDIVTIQQNLLVFADRHVCVSSADKIWLTQLPTSKATEFTFTINCGKHVASRVEIDAGLRQMNKGETLMFVALHGETTATKNSLRTKSIVIGVTVPLFIAVLALVAWIYYRRSRNPLQVQGIGKSEKTVSHQFQNPIYASRNP